MGKECFGPYPCLCPRHSYQCFSVVSATQGAWVGKGPNCSSSGAWGFPQSCPSSPLFASQGKKLVCVFSYVERATLPHLPQREPWGEKESHLLGMSQPQSHQPLWPGPRAHGIRFLKAEGFQQREKALIILTNPYTFLFAQSVLFERLID